MSRVTVKGNDRESVLFAENGACLLEVLRAGGLAPAAPCGGEGKCGKCRVELTQNGKTKTVLACCTKLAGDCEIALEKPDADGGDICAETATPAGRVFGAESGYGCAADIGTTTVVVRLLSLEDGRVLGERSGWNAQTPYGADVISRVRYCMEHENGLSRLTQAIRGQLLGYINALCRDCGVSPAALCRLCLAGNTIMEHIFAGYSPVSIAAAPFRPQTLFDGGEAAPLPELPSMELYYAPCVAGYVGGDILAGMLAAGFGGSAETALLLDIGTNGEMALQTESGIVCCAVACGPAFEGAEISCGMTGVPGAVSHAAWKNGAPELSVIGGGTPKGICGSGLVALLSALLRSGAVDETGRLLPPAEAPKEAAAYLTQDGDGNGVFHLTADGAVVLTAADVRKLQLAKAAVAAGIEVLLKTAGLEAGDVKRLYMAGGFGNRLDPAAATAIGMIPQELRERVEFIGNSSLAGIETVLLEPQQREKLLMIRRRCRYLELSGNAAFNAAYIDNMMFDDGGDIKWNCIFP